MAEDIEPLTEFRRMVLVATNITERQIKIAMFTVIVASTPLYVEKSTMVESNTTRTVKVKIRINAVLLVRVMRV